MRNDYSPALGIIFLGGKFFYNGFIIKRQRPQCQDLFLAGQVVKLKENKFAYFSFRSSYYCLVEVNVFEDS